MTPDEPRADVAGFLAYLAASGAPPMWAGSVDAARMGMRGNVEVADAPPVPLVRIENVSVPGPAGALPARLYDRRATRGPGPLILFLHGGGFVIGDLETHHSFCTWLADAIDLPLLALDYRLAPEHPFPAAPDDAEAAARWVATSPAVLGLDVTGLILCGDSAGGNLAIVTAQQLAQYPAQVPVRAQWVLYPYIGAGTDWPSVDAFGEGFLIGRADMAWFDGHYGAPGDDPRHNCLHGPMPLAPLLIQTAGLDPLLDQGEAYASRAEALGAPVRRLRAQGMIHGYVNLRGALPSAQGDCAAFVEAARAMLADIGNAD